MGNKIPSSWFDDDPEWEMLRRKAEKRPVPKQLKQKVAAQRPQIKREPREQPRAQASKQVSDKEVVLNLKLAVPKIKLPDFKKLYRMHQKRIFAVGGAVACLLLIVGTFKFISARQAASDAKKPVSAQDQAKQAFNPLIPLENLTDSTGKQSEPEYAFDEEKKVLGYNTEYNGAILTISQQQAPEDFKSNPASLMSLASSINANTPLETQKGTAYIATDEKTKAQTAVFATDEVLVFIRTDKSLDEEEWKFYINQLNPSK